MLDGIDAWLHDTAYELLLGATGCNGVDDEARVIDAMIDRGMDGMILIAPLASPARLEHVANTVPTVVVGRIADRHRPSTHVKLSPTLVVRRTTAAPTA